jgi:hypothetical protein
MGRAIFQKFLVRDNIHLKIFSSVKCSKMDFYPKDLISASRI